MGEALCVCVGLPPQPVSAFISFYIKQQTHMHKHLMHGDRNMMRHSCVSLLSFFAVVSSRSVPTASLYGSVAAQPDYTLNLQPPQETPQDIEASLEAITAAEDAKRMLSDHEFDEAKQSMIVAEKQRIRDMVRSAFAA